MAERALFIGFGQPVRGREERAVAVFNALRGLCRSARRLPTEEERHVAGNDTG